MALNTPTISCLFFPPLSFRARGHNLKQVLLLAGSVKTTFFLFFRELMQAKSGAMPLYLPIESQSVRIVIRSTR